jgi:hypothetical protein
VIEQVCYSTTPGTDEGDAVDAWVCKNYLKFANRMAIMYGVISRAEESPYRLPLLRTVVAAETAQDDLEFLLRELSNVDLPNENTDRTLHDGGAED